MEGVPIKYFNFILILTASLLFAQSDNPDWWQSFYKKGLDYIKTENFEQAEAEFNKILEQEKIAQGYLGLGILYEIMGPGSKKAEKQFEAAIRKDRKFALAYYWLGMNTQNQPNKLIEARSWYRKAVHYDPKNLDAWIKLGMAEEELEQVSEAVKAYCNAYYNNPANPKIYQIFIDAAMKFHGSKEAQKTLEKLVKENRENDQIRVDFAEMNYLMEEYQEAQKVLDKLPTGFTSTKKLLTQAKIWFATGDTLKAQNCYWQAVSSIQDSLDGAIVVQDFIYLLKQNEYDEYKATFPSNLPGFIHRFWTARDPNRATKINERLTEHYARLLYVLKNNRRYTRGYSVNESLYESLHPFDMYNLQGNKLLAKADFPIKVLENRNIDDMGLIFLRHGKPDKQVTSVDGYPDFIDKRQIQQQQSALNSGADKDTRVARVPKAYMGESLILETYGDNLPINVSWKYNATRSGPEMIFHFKLYGGHTSWIMEAIPYTFANREELDPKYLRIGRTAFQAMPDMAALTQYANEVQQDAVEATQLALTSETTDYKFNAEPIRVLFQLLAFKGENGKNDVDLFYLIEGKETELQRVEDKNILNLNVFSGFYDEKWGTLLEENSNDQLSLNSTQEQWQNQSLLDKKSFLLVPGSLNYELQFEHRLLNKLATYQGIFSNPDYNVDSLILSSAILSGTILPKGNNTKFTKGDVAYFPHMFTAFKQDEIVGLYFEIYNLGVDAHGKTSFSIDCSMDVPDESGQRQLAAVRGYFRTLFGSDIGQVTTSYTYTGNSRDEKIYLNLDMKDIEPGNHDLQITVKDNNANTGVKQSIKLSILSNEDTVKSE